MVDFTNIEKKIKKLDSVSVDDFDSVTNSFRFFLERIKVELFRHLREVDIKLSHPVTVISGTNKIGKTSILLLVACSHEKFIRLDASKPEPTIREHAWKDVMVFTKYENEANDYSYRMWWHLGKKKLNGQGKRLASSKAWSGLGKKAKDRTNAKIRDREVRLVDLDRLLPARSFSASLLRKTSTATVVELDAAVCKAFCYVLERPYSASFSIKEVSSHVNKRCYLVEDGVSPYSSYNAATGEESLITLLREAIESPKDSLILIDEIEAGLHPSVQRRLLNAICLISWEDKKQFIVTSHSHTVLDSVHPRSRKFLEAGAVSYKVINGISPQAALSKMDSTGHPLVILYCEDDLAEYLISKVLVDIGKIHKDFPRLIDIVRSGPANQVLNDFDRHAHKFPQTKLKQGYSAVFDGDMFSNPEFSAAVSDPNCHFLHPRLAPEKFLVSAFLAENPSNELETFLQFDNHHTAFQKMVELGLAADISDARAQCYASFERSGDYQIFFDQLKEFLIAVTTRFSDPEYTPA